MFLSLLPSPNFGETGRIDLSRLKKCPSWTWEIALVKVFLFVMKTPYGYFTIYTSPPNRQHCQSQEVICLGSQSCDPYRIIGIKFMKVWEPTKTAAPGVPLFHSCLHSAFSNSSKLPLKCCCQLMVPSSSSPNKQFLAIISGLTCLSIFPSGGLPCNLNSQRSSGKGIGF